MLKSLFSKPYSSLFIVGDNADWAIDEEAKALANIASKLGLRAQRIKKAWLNLPQIVHYASQFSILDPKIYKTRHRISVDYFHGRPEDGESYRKCWETLRDRKEITRIRVSNTLMAERLKNFGVSSEKIYRIPIGVDLNLFPPKTKEKQAAARSKFGLPQEAVVIGSFQKDGVGWGEGNEPKLIKGPDIFIDVIKKLKEQVPNLWVLLSGPSRGFVINSLKALSVPFVYKRLDKYEEVSELYDTLDLYLITSREEGGPKSCLEAMAKGVPLVTTEVGQVKDLVRDGENAIMAQLDAGKLAELSEKLLKDASLKERLVQNGFHTAEQNSLEAQLPLWKSYFQDLTRP